MDKKQNIWETAQFGTIALILVIATAVVGVIPQLSPLAAVIAFGAIAGGALSLAKKENPRWPAIVSLVLGGLGLLGTVTLFIATGLS